MSGSTLDPAGGGQIGAAPAPYAKPASRSLKLLGWFSVVMSTLLVTAELVAIDTGLAIALRGTLHLRVQGEYIIAALGAVIALWVVYRFFLAAFRYEIGGGARP